MTELNFFDPAFREDPYPTYAELRQKSPVATLPFGFVAVLRHRDCQMVMRQPGASSDRRRSPRWQMWLEASPDHVRRYIQEVDRYRPFLFLDPPDHTRLRGLVSRAFNPAVVARLRESATTRARSLVERATAGDSIDVVDDLARPLPVAIISELMGVPAEYRQKMTAWSDVLAESLEPVVSFSQAEAEHHSASISEFALFIIELAAHRRRNPGPDLVSGLVAEADAASDDELAATCMLLLAAGHETTRNLIGNAVFALATHPRQADLLRRGEVPLRQAVEEMIRYDSPVQLLLRFLDQPIELSGTEVAAHTELLLLIGSANRDEEAFAGAGELDIARQPGPHLGFGFGAHHCLGAALARMEAEAALAALLERLPALELVGVPRRRQTLVLRGFDSLRLAV